MSAFPNISFISARILYLKPPSFVVDHLLLTAFHPPLNVFSSVVICRDVVITKNFGVKTGNCRLDVVLRNCTKTIACSAAGFAARCFNIKHIVNSK